MALASGHQVIDASEEENAKQVKLFEAYMDGMITLQPGGWFFTKPFSKYANTIYKFKYKPNDVMIMTFPKCGTTWMQEIVWTMRNNKDFSNPMAKIPVNARCPFLEFDFICDYKNCPPVTANPQLMATFEKMCPGQDIKDGIFHQLAAKAPEPRTMKTHLPFSLLSKDLLETCKVIYVIRDPKDVVVSFHHHSQILKPHDYVGTFDQFVDLFVEDKVLFGPFWQNVREAFERQKHPNLYICYYEDLKKDPQAEYQKLSTFLETNITEEQIKKIVTYTSFEVMKVREKVLGEAKEGEENPFENSDIVSKAGGFFRKGVAGDWKNKLNAEQVKKINEWTKKNIEGLDIKHKYGAF